MDTSLIGSEAVELLSRITGQKLSQRDLTPPVIFLAALITVLLGVMFADETISDEEKHRWQKTINHFIPPEGNVRQLTQLLSKGVRLNQIYKKTEELLTLTAPLSKSEKLLLIGFGYEIAAADGEMAKTEKKYLETIAQLQGLNSQYLKVLEAGFTRQGEVNPSVLDEVQSLLDPARFHELDSVFVKAASDLLMLLPTKLEDQETQKNEANAYQKLQAFQNSRKKLSNFCEKLFQIIQNCSNRDFLPPVLIEDTEKILQKLKSQRFRIAVVGEFSQGKSTLLNALLGEKIQPVRAIPCSGAVTVLKWGAQRRVFCCYKDGRKEEILFEQYHIKAAISKEAARDCRSDELARSEIDEIILEHPDLQFCRNGVEIVDSPGLNEHPDRTAVTQKLIKDTDAVIFLANAQRLFPEKEQELLQDLKIQINDGSQDKTANNLFVVVNFMDMLDEEDDRQDVLERTESVLLGQNPIVAGKNRIHFISAKAALNAILNRVEDEYLKDFYSFTQAIEKFLTDERGSQEIGSIARQLQSLIQATLKSLNQAEEVLDGNLKLSEAAKQRIIEQIGEAGGRDVRIQILANEIREITFEEANESWNEWIEGLGERLASKVENWSTNHNPLFSQHKVIQDYVDQFLRDLQREIDTWGNKNLKDKILKPHFEVLDDWIEEELKMLQENLSILDQDINTDFSKQLNLSILGIEGGAGNLFDYLGGGLFGGGLGAGLLILLGLGGPIILAVAGLGAAIAGALGFGIGGLHDQIKLKVFETGLTKFVESTEQLTDTISESIGSVFDKRVEAAVKVIEQAILLCENLLEQQEKAHQETLDQREAEKAFVAQKRQELEQVQQNLDAILNQVAA